MATPTKQQVEQAFIDKPDLADTFYHPASGGYAKPGKGNWNIYDWAERYGAQELPNIFGGAVSTPTPTPLPNVVVPQTESTPLAPGGITTPTPMTPTIPTPIVPGSSIQAPVIYPDGTLVRAEGDNKVYLINPEGKRAHIPDSETLNKLFGTGAWANIKTITAGELQGITEGTALTSETAGAEEGTTRVNPQTGKREIFQSGIWNPTEAFDVETKNIISSADVVEGTTLSSEAQRAIEEGELVSGIGTPEVYLAEGGVLKHIPSPSEFEKMGYKWENIRDVAPSLLESFKQGGSVSQFIQQVGETLSDHQSIIDQAKADSQVEDIEAEQETARKSITDILKGIPDLLTKWWEDPAIVEKQEALTETRTNIANLEAAKQTALDISKNRLESTAFISGEQEQIKDKMNIEINLELAKEAILLDDIELATDLAEKSIELAIKQEELKLTAAQQALSFIEADLTREDQEVANKIEFALIQYQSELEQIKTDANNRANTYAQIIATYGDIPGLDPSMSVTEQWALVGPQATTERNLRMQALQKQISDTGTTVQTGVIPALEAGKLGVPYGTTYEEYAIMSAPAEWDDEEFRVAFRNMIAGNATYQDALDEITLDGSILNKDRGKFIAAEMWGQVEPGTNQAVFEGKATSTGDIQTTLPQGSSNKTQLPKSPGLGIFDDYQGTSFPDVINLFK